MATSTTRASTSTAHFYCRGVDGIWRVKGTGQPFEKDPSFPSETSRKCKFLEFSQFGDKAAWHDGTVLKIYDVNKNQLIQTIENPAISLVTFSPLGTVLATWQNLAVADKQPIPNLLLYSVSTGQVIGSFVQKKAHGWEPQWSKDEKICVRNVNNELYCYEDNNFDQPKNRLNLQKISEFQVAKNDSPYVIGAYIPGVKGLPANVRLYKYPNFSGMNSALASKTFFKADRVSLEWNSKGTAILILASTETSESSYYGEQGLHFLATNGDSCVVPLGKQGPVYSYAWNPSGVEFTVVYGYMPAKCTIYNLKNDPVFDFGTGPRNQVFYNAFGNILCLAGFGNLQGSLEFWDLEKYKLISSVSAKDTTHFEWAPDGCHILCSTLSPRMRVGNGYKIWHYTGSLMKQVTFSAPNYELWQTSWCPLPKGSFTKPAISYTPVPSSEAAPIVQANVPAYRPPGARGLQTAATKIHEYEPPSNAKQTASAQPAQEKLSKNQKRRRAKAAAESGEGAGNQPERPASSKSASSQVPGNSQTKQQPPANPGNPVPTQGQQQQPAKPGNPVSTQGKQVPPSSANQPDVHIVPLTGDPEKDKAIKNLTKKLQQINKLKEDKAKGIVLQNNQLEKISKEDEIIEELENLAFS